MICEQIPCTCFAKPLKAKRVSAPKRITVVPTEPVVPTTTASTPPVTRGSARGAMARAAARKQPPVAPEVVAPVGATVERELDRNDPAFITAIRALAPLLHVSEIALYASSLRVETPRDRAQQWRMRRSS